MSTGERIYLDNNATTALAPEVRAAIDDAAATAWANPSSLHREGKAAFKALRAARRDVAALVGASPAELSFTSGGTESINLALAGLCARAGIRRIFVSAVEHPAVLEATQALELSGLTRELLPVDRNGQIDCDALSAALEAGPALVSVMWANNETGICMPMEEIARRVHAAGGLLHSDAVQAPGRMDLQGAAGLVDLLSLSAHKFHGPRGMGALYVRRGLALDPQIRGGGQEGGLRAGTENVLSAVGMAAACRLARDAPYASMAALRDRLETSLLEAVPGAEVIGAAAVRLPNTTLVGFPVLEGESVLMRLDDLGVAVSLGSACATGKTDISHVLKAMAVPPRLAAGCIRFSLSRYTSAAEVEATVQAVADVARA